VKFAAVRKISFSILFAGVLLAPIHSLRAQETPAAPTQATSAAASFSHPSLASEQEVDEKAAYRHSEMVRRVGKMFGMDAEQAATSFEIFNFAILAILLLWLVVKTLPKAFRNRSGVIQKQLVDARTVTEEAAIRLSGVEARLSKLDEQIAAMRTQSEKDAAADEQHIKASVEEEKQKILTAAEQEIAAATTHARRQLQQYAAELAIDQAAQKLVVSAETDRLLVQAFASRLAGEDVKGGQN
jgi:F-type H+-transporting ATPase subunit b